MTMTSDDVTQQSTTGNVMASSSSRDIVAYCFAYTVVFIGAVGTVANALVLYAMKVSKQHKKQTRNVKMRERLKAGRKDETLRGPENTARRFGDQ